MLLGVGRRPVKCESPPLFPGITHVGAHTRKTVKLFCRLLYYYLVIMKVRRCKNSRMCVLEGFKLGLIIVRMAGLWLDDKSFDGFV